MSKIAHPKLSGRDARGLLVNLLGSQLGWPMLLAVILIMAVGWLADGLFGLAEAGVGRLLTLSGPRLHWLADPDRVHVAAQASIALVGMLILMGFHRWARRARERYPFTVDIDTQPRKVRALILFLSFPGNDEIRERYARLEGDLSAPGTLRALERAPWRMPLEAIRYHMPKLEHVVLIGSSGPGGTRREVDAFRKLLDRLVPGHHLHVATVDELMPTIPRTPARAAELGHAPAIDARGGFSFHDPETLFMVVEAVLAHLVGGERLAPEDILIDVTGGTALASVAGAAAAGGLFRRFEYVAFDERTEHYEVRTMKPTFGSPKTG